MEYSTQMFKHIDFTKSQGAHTDLSTSPFQPYQKVYQIPPIFMKKYTKFPPI